MGLWWCNVLVPSQGAKLAHDIVGKIQTKEERVAEIDRKIAELEEMKRGYEGRALRHENQAERLQFEDQAVLETRKHNQLAEENREKAAAIQREIDKLKAERKTLTK
jgi:predicted transcriptional regulator